MSTGPEDAALLAEIARLTGQIDQHRHQQQYPRPTPVYNHAHRGRGAPYRGAFRGRGRGSAPHSLPSSSRHRTLVINNGNNAAPSSSDGELTAASDASLSSAQQQQQKAGWVKRKTTHNMSLVSSDTFEKTEPARIAALQAAQQAKAKAKAERRESRQAATRPSKAPKPSSASVRRGDNMGEVIIDGVVFAFDETGTKLVKKPVNDNTSTDAQQQQTQHSEASSSAGSKAPLRTSVNGQAFVRTKGGNLISAELAEKRKSQAKMKKMENLGQQIGQNERVRSANRKPQNAKPKSARPKGLCSFFNKTGQCKRGLSCPYQHDSSKLAICPGALRPSGCNQAQGMCPLSHQLNPHRVPHCVHFLRSSGRDCRNGDDCFYLHPSPHVASVLTPTSPVCMDFAKYGWCDKGKECTSRHTFDCPDFLEKGSCERKGCKLQHVIRSGGETSSAPTSGPSTSDHHSVQPSHLISAVGSASAGRDKKRRAEDASEGSSSASASSSGDEGEVDDGVYSFVDTKGSRGNKRRKRTKAFTEQKDYIGFDDEEEEDDDDDSSDEDRGDEHDDADDDEGSVSSGSDAEESSGSDDGDSDSDDGGSSSSSH